MKNGRDGGTDRGMDAWADGRMDRKMEGWMGQRMHGWMEGRCPGAHPWGAGGSEGFMGFMELISGCGLGLPRPRRALRDGGTVCHWGCGKQWSGR